MSQDEKLRLFIGIELPLSIQTALGDAQFVLKKVNTDVKWVETRNIHLTLKFLGYIQMNKIDLIKEKTRDAVKGFSPFEASISKNIDVFPNIKNIRVLWVGIEEGKEIIQKIQMQIEDNLERIDIEKEERKFTPHLTIGRLKSTKSKESLLEQIEKTHFDKAHRMRISKITLFQSTLTRKGPVYKILSEVNLG